MTQSSGCEWCGGELTGRQRKYDKPECGKLAAREAWLKKTYDLTLDEYQKILAWQGNKCGCCRKPFVPGKTPHVDHEHGGPVRGVVCAYCNTRLIGRLKSADLAQKLADYLLRPPALDALPFPRIAPGRPKRKRRKRGV